MNRSDKPRYIHRSSSSASSPSNLQRLVATSIEEESEPCELHCEIDCQYCRDIISSKMSDVLKRSISYNAVNNLTRRNNASHQLHRTLSQTSCYSTGSTKSQSLNAESFNEFLYFLNGDDYFTKANTLWEKLPKETKDVFVARVLSKRKKSRNPNLEYNDIKDLFSSPTKSSFMHYRQKLNPHFHQAAPGLKEQTISKIVGEIYNNGLTAAEKASLQKEAQQNYEEITSQRLAAVRDTIHKVEASTATDPYLEEIRAWQNREEIVNRMAELNALIEKFNTNSNAVNTPTSIRSPTVLATTPTKKKEPSIFGKLSNQSKKIVQRFKKKKLPAALNLYRKPNPDVRVLVSPPKKA